jgi:hypothetical protein
LIDIVTNVFEVFKTIKVVVRDTFDVKRPKPKSSMLVEPIDALGGKPIDDLTTSVEQITLND